VNALDGEQDALVLQGVLVLVLGHHRLLVCVWRYDLHLRLLPSCGDHDYSLDDDPAVLEVQNLEVRYDREHLSMHHEDLIC
jgi:hypothetical protein